MAEEVAEVKEMEKVYDISQGKYVEKEKEPVKIKEKPSNPIPDYDEEGKEVKPVKESKAKKEPEEEEEVEEVEAKEPDFNSYLKEKYSIDDEDQLQKILDSNQKFEAQIEELKKASKDPVYKSDKQKKLIEWLDQSGYDLDKIGDGLESAATLMNLNVEKLEDRKALEEAFIIDNTDITREEAKKLFARDYKKYNLNEEDFADEAEFKEAQELADIQRKKDVAKAKKVLLANQEKLKATEPEKKKEEAPKEVTAPKEAVEFYSKQINDIFTQPDGKKFDRFIFEDDNDPNIKITVKIPEDKLKFLKEMSIDYLKNTTLYDQNKKIPNFDPQKHIKQVFDALYGDWKDEQMFKQITTLAKSLRAEQLAGFKPTKESKSGGKGDGIPSYSDQFKELARKAKIDRERSGVR